MLVARHRRDDEDERGEHGRDAERACDVEAPDEGIRPKRLLKKMKKNTVNRKGR